MLPFKNYISKLSFYQLADLAEFIVHENYNHHTNEVLPENYTQEIDAIYHEELSFYKSSEIFVSKDVTGNINGTIRVLKWNFKDLLPIQKIFGIHPFMALKKDQVNEIFHIGRFAIKKNAGNLNLFKKLITCSIAPICNHKDNIAFAEVDSKLLRVFKLIGIQAKVIGKSTSYLGSETIPVSLNYDGVIDFYNKNKSLVHLYTNQKTTTQLHKSLVFNPLNTNYTSV